MGRENARARQGYWPRPAREELTAAKKNISNVSAHESSRSCAVRAIPVEKISSRFPRVEEEEEALRQTGMRSRRRCSMPLPPSGKVKKEEEMAQLSSQPVESPESKYQTWNDGKNKEQAGEGGTGANIGAEREDASPTGMEDTH